MERIAQSGDVTQFGTIARGKWKRKLTEDRKKQNRDAQRRFRERKKVAQSTDVPPVSAARKPAFEAQQALAIRGSIDLPGPNLDVDFDVMPFEAILDASQSVNATSESAGSGDTTMNSWISSLAVQTRDQMAVPSPYMNYLQLQKLNFYAARIQNAKHIGVPQKLAEVDHALSPWYWDTQYSLMFLHAYPPDYSNVLLEPPTVNRGELFPARFGYFPQPLRPQRCFHINNNVNEDLSPTHLQRSKAHALYIDMIPFPIFRDRVITLLDMSPPAFDEDELRRDMEHDGVLVWGGARAERSVRDRRNWECAKWFLAKWKILVNGSGMEDQSRWWRQMRGEDDSDEET